MESSIESFVQGCPIVDNHCHPLVSESQDAGSSSQLSLLGSLSEASGPALQDAKNSISVKRSVRELCSFLEVPEPWSLESLDSFRRRQDPQSLAQKLLGACRFSALLIDDGLRIPAAHPVAYHESLVPLSLRVLRIEAVAEDILARGPASKGAWTLGSFEEAFLQTLNPSPRSDASATLPENVVALKSIAAYRCGLDIIPSVDPAEAEAGLQATLASRTPEGSLRLMDRHFISFLISLALELAHLHDIPLQMHTGFGDKDLDLRLANPLFLRPLLEQQEKDGSCARVVLLHCSYPFCREAGFLATVYQKVYLDCGLVFGKMSSHGMQFCTDSLLELAPLNKIMFSTDAYGFADAFFLACKQGRACLSQALAAAVRAGDLTLREALEAAADILSNNALRVYRLSSRAPTLKGTALAPVPVPTTLPLPLPLNPSTSAGGGAPSGTGVAGGHTGSVLAAGQGQASGESLLVRLLFADTSGQRRTRVVPMERYRAIVEKQGVGITRSIYGFASFADGPTPNCGLSATGEVRIVPDAKTLRRLPWYPEHSVAMVTAVTTTGVPFSCCGRATLERLSRELFLRFNLTVRAAFETEFILLKSTSPSLVAADQSSYCSAISLEGTKGVLTDVFKAIQGLNVPVEQIHAESAGGQFEVAVGHAPAVEAADNVLLTREAVSATALQHGLHATCLPSVIPNQAANGAHLHLSIWRRDPQAPATPPGSRSSTDGLVNAFATATPGASAGGGEDWGISDEGRWFMAGVLEHLPAILAISCPLPNSYQRLKPNCWAGAYQCWGFENREAAIRVASPPTPGAPPILDPTGSSKGTSGPEPGSAEAKAAQGPRLGPTNFEVKGCDGAAQPHLVIAAVIAAGMDGIAKKTPLPSPVEANPADLHGAQALPPLPSTLDDAVAAFEADSVLQDSLGEELCRAIVAVRKAESSHYVEKSPEDAALHLVHKY